MAFPGTLSRSDSLQSRTPVYRRPSWAKTETSHQIYLRKGLAANRSPGVDYGLENFTYDEEHLSKWQMPTELSDRLPPKLREAVADWQYAGAAVCTALARIVKLDYESIYRGYPEKTFAHLSRRSSQQSPAVVGAETPPYGPPLSIGQSAVPANLLREKMEGLPQRQFVGMESPPFTPIDSKACSTPATSYDSPDWKPELSHINNRLGPLSTNDVGTNDVRTDSVTGAVVAKPDFKPEHAGSFSSAVSTVSSTPASPEFHEPSWETFCNFYKAELLDIRTNSWPRFTGFSFVIDRARYEVSRKPENADVVKEFEQWFASMKPKVAEYEKEVRQLEEPSLELMRLERQAMGLPL